MGNIDFSRLEALVKKTGKSKTWLCRCLGRPAYFLRDAKKSGTRLSDAELEILANELGTCPEYLMGLSSQEKPLSLPFVRREIDDIYDGLNSQGQDELSRYGQYLLSREDMKAIELKPRVDYIRYYRTAAAAGYAAPIEGEDFELIPRDVNTPHGADFCIDISGDSMEPYIKDGSRVYVQRDMSLKDLDVGVFYLDGDVYCKQFCVDYAGNVCLLSANPRREDANIYINRGCERNLVCFGRVLLGRRLPMPVYE